MTAFLDRLARQLLEQHGPRLDRVLVVLPGRRAGLHLRKYLAQHHGGALWSPDLVDPAGFLELVSGWKQASSASSLLALHACHRELAGPRAESLTAFLQWAPTTVRDMSTVDAHLIDLEKLYRDLRAYHEIEEWSLKDIDAPSPSQQRALQHWSTTGDLHRLFAQRMDERRVGTYGAVARAAAHVSADPSWAPGWDMVWAAGLNALDPASLAVMKALKKKGLLRVEWDADRFYLDDPAHEAGIFMREAIAVLGSGAVKPREAITTEERRIELVHLADRASMARFAGQWAMSIPESERAKAAIILADEQMLMPVVEALPAELGPVNISLGVPLNALPVHGLIDQFVRLSAKGPLRTKDLVGFLAHPMLNQGGRTDAAVASLLEPGWPQWERAAFLDLLARSELPVDARAAFSDGNALPHERIQSVLGWARLARQDDPLAQEQLYLLAEQERQINTALTAHDSIAESLIDHHDLRSRLLAEASLTLLGEPLSGLQVLGMLETRAIDHEHVLVLGASEGMLAGREEHPSWIPFEVRRRWGLPMRRDSDALSSYHTHRLLHVAKRLCLAHAQAPDGGGSPVRYFEQWRQGFATSPRVQMVRTQVNAKVSLSATVPIRIRKDGAVLAALRQLFERGLSPSALGTWLRCPQDFHARYVLGIRDNVIATEDLGDDALGRAVHAAAEIIYAPWLGRAVRSEDLRAAAARADEMVMRALATEFPDALLRTGSYLIKASIAGEALRRALLAESEACGQRVTVPLALEKDLRAELKPGVFITGKADRIEHRDGVLCVIDLKTGGVRANELALKSLDRDAVGPEQVKALQLLIYAALVLRMNEGTNEVRAGIQPLRKPSQAEHAWLTIEGEAVVTRDRLPAIETLLMTIVDEIMDPVVPFMHRIDNQWCTSCVH